MNPPENDRLGKDYLLKTHASPALWWGWFPIFLVLYEVSVYTANDMIQPAMPQVVADYGVPATWIATSLTAFMLGGGLFTWLLGP